MATWNAPKISAPPMTKDVEVLQQYVKQLSNTVALMAKDLDFVLNGNLDVKNIHADSIDTNMLKAGAVTTDKLVAGAVTAGKIDVDELSAITANMGKLTSGEIYGAYIATRENDYPRAEMSNTENMFGAFKSPSNSVQIYSPVEKFSPVIKFEVNGVLCYIFYDPTDNTFSMTSNTANINISTQRRVELFGDVYLYGWSFLKHNGNERSLQDELTDIDNRLKILEGH